MRHSPAELIALARQYYPGIGVTPSTPEYRQTAEYRRIVERRRQAITTADYEVWRGLLRRLRDRFPECDVENAFPHFWAAGPVGAHVGGIRLPTLARDVGFHSLAFGVSFLVPYYVLHSYRYLFCDEPDGHGNLFPPAERRIELTPEEQPYADGIAREIEVAFPGYELMPPELGYVVVPYVQHPLRCAGEATIYDCLIDDLTIPPKTPPEPTQSHR
ncbi:hypothetical protein [Polyangium sp. 6x1]|uniref:hypothetical protein n=1 Tax=Polyangium sp. 6x1 TaxID=3042689 RepID=UPI0024830FE7|nr:hypothetical protein [Polyangium sp. 6x1]MDI1451248.1 hypothetical protein [Polyangium sp. 6x1]